LMLLHQKDSIRSLLPLVVIFRFRTLCLFQLWNEAISHWTDNSGTLGIATKYFRIALKDKSLPLQLCCMDFAGQNEFEYCH
jgi:hypothetical protein